MKNRAENNRLNETLKIADIDSEKLSEGLERCSKNPQGIRSLPHFRALPEPVLAGRQEKGAVAPFSAEQDIPWALCQSTFAAYPHNRLHRLFWYSTVLLTPAVLLCRSVIFLYVQDSLLSEEDEQLPFARHVIGTLQQFHFIENVVFLMFVWAQEVVISNLESQVIARPWMLSKSFVLR